jgi:cytochrome d ubiquinol oxidase subunit I
MRTSDAVSHHSAEAVGFSLVLFIIVYFAVFGTGIIYLLRLVAVGPDRGGGTARPADIDQPQKRPARPLSAVPDQDPATIGAGE